MALSISNYKKGTPGGTASKKRTTFGVSNTRQALSNNKESASNISNTSANDDKIIEPTTTQAPPATTPAVAPAVPVPSGATAGQPIDLSGLMPGSASYNEAVRYNQSLTASTTKPPVGPDGPPEPVNDVPPGTTPGPLIIGSVSREGNRGRGSQWAGQEMPAEFVSQVPADNMAEFSAAVTKGPMALMSYLTNNIAQPWAKSILMGLRSNRARGTANVARTYEGGNMWDRSPAWMKQRYMQNTAPEPVPAIQPAQPVSAPAPYMEDTEPQPLGQQKGQLGQLPPGWAYGFNGQEWVPINTQGGQYSNTQSVMGGDQYSQSGGIVDPRQLQYQQLMQQLPYFAALLQGSVPQQGGY